MNVKIMQAMGYNKELELLKQGKCTYCASDKTKDNDFKDPISLKEFKISGLCQKCQDEIWN